MGLAPLQRWPICNILAISICGKLEMWIQSITCGPSMLWQNLSLVTCSSTAATKLWQVLHHMDIFAAAAASFAVAVAVSTYSVSTNGMTSPFGVCHFLPCTTEHSDA